MFPTVPYFALPELHKAVQSEMPRPYAGIIDVYKEIVPALLRQSRDRYYYVARGVPA